MSMGRPKAARPLLATERQKKRNPPTELAIGVAQRLRVLQSEMENTDAEMAKIAGTRTKTWTNWTNAENKPNEEAMVRLCNLTAVTMDWIYRGIPDGLQHAQAIRLTARLEIAERQAHDRDEAIANALLGATEPAAPEHASHRGVDDPPSDVGTTRRKRKARHAA